MVRASTRWRNLGAAAGGAAAALFAIFDLYQWAAAYAADHFHNDFTFYYVAAKIGLAHGWASIYDLSIQQAQLDLLDSKLDDSQLGQANGVASLGADGKVPAAQLPAAAAGGAILADGDYGDVAVSGLGIAVGSDDAVGVAVEIADDRVQLTQRDANASHTTRLQSDVWPPAARDG